MGRFASGPEVGDEQYICPACRNAFASRGSLTSHCRSTHGKPLAILEIEAGLEPSRKPPEQLTCPTCGKVVLGKQGMGSHTAAMHPGGANQPKLVKVG